LARRRFLAPVWQGRGPCLGFFQSLEQVLDVVAQGGDAREIEALLAEVPDLRPVLADAEPDELAELLEPFDVEVTYDRETRRSNLPRPSRRNSFRPQKDCNRLVGGRCGTSRLSRSTSGSSSRHRRAPPTKPVRNLASGVARTSALCSEFSTSSSESSSNSRLIRFEQSAISRMILGCGLTQQLPS
jgi:hypothetical protein